MNESVENLDHDEEDIYPTRGRQERFLPRVDPVVYGAGAPVGEYSLAPEQVHAYARDGFLVVPGVFSEAEIARFHAAYEALAQSPDYAGHEEFVFEPDSQELRSIFAIHRFSELFDRLTRDRRILEKVMQLLGGEVYLHHSRINIKRPLNGRSFAWHSDFETWHAEDGLPRCRVLSVWVMLTENDEFNGPLYLVPGSHERFLSCAGETPDENYKKSLRRQEFGVPSLDALRTLYAERGLASAKGKPGTLVFHEGNTMHGSPDNITPDPRTNMFFVYNSVYNKPASRPYAAERFRPDFLGGKDFAPLVPVDNDFTC